MPVYTTPTTAVAGQTLPAATWNTGVRDSLEAVAKPPRVRVRRTTSQSIPNATGTAISWDAEDYDSDGMWTAASPTIFTIPTTGYWEFKFGGQFAINATGARLLFITVAGGVKGIFNGVGNASWFVGSTVSAEVYATASMQVQFLAYQSSGAALNIDLSSYEVWATGRLVSR